jgi:hypothetical protein
VPRAALTRSRTARAFVLALCALLAEAAGGAAELADRIVAVVDGDPILESDLERALALGTVERPPVESAALTRRRVLDGLIAQRLRVHAVERFGFEQVPVERIAEQVEAIRSRFASDEEFRRRLAALGMGLEGLEQMVARQLQVMVYVDELLGARVFVGLEEIEAHYRRVLAPQLERAGEPVPPLPEVAEEIRELLRQQRLDQELERWTAEIRRQAVVQDYLEAPRRPLPPKVGERP